MFCSFKMKFKFQVNQYLIFSCLKTRKKLIVQLFKFKPNSNSNSSERLISF